VIKSDNRLRTPGPVLPLLLLILCLAARPPVAGGEAAPAPMTAEPPEDTLPPGYIMTTLPNGLRVSILPAPLDPVVATEIWYHVGSANEEPSTRGFAHLFEHMMFTGTTRHAGRDYWDLHYRFGGETNASTWFDETIYVSEIPPEGHGALLDLEADRMTRLALTEENLENEKRIVTEELRLTTENDPLGRLALAALRRMLGEHPYAPSPIGTKADIAAATLDHAREFYAKFYGPSNAHLVIVGPVEGEATLEQVRETFGALPPRGATPPDVPAVEGWPLPEEIVLKDDIPPIKVSILAWPLPPYREGDVWALRVLRAIFAAGRADPFREEIVTRRRMALEAGSFVEGVRRGGIFAFYAANLPYRRRATAFRSMEEARAALGKMDWLTDETLEGAKRSLRRTILARDYFARRQADAIARAAWWLDDERLAFEENARIAAVTREDVAKAFRKYVLEPRPVRILVLPEHVPLWLRLFGWLYPLVG
jgi:zinc protease